MENHSTFKDFFDRHDKTYLMSFLLITACFALWGFANNVTTPMVGVFSRIFRMSTIESSLVTIAFNLGYFCMAIPAALYIQRYSYKGGILIGLGLYALGAVMFFPSRIIGEFYPFLFSYFILTCGLSFLETSCNPYIYSMGSERHATQRLNMVQSFNALGTVAGMLVAMEVHKHISNISSQDRLHLPLAQFNILKDYDLRVLTQPYIFIAAIVVIILVLLAFTKMPNDDDRGRDRKLTDIAVDLFHKPNYREGVLAQFCYVGAQVACWTYIIQYGLRLFTSEGLTEQEAMIVSQKYNIAALVLFAFCRFIATWLMQWFKPSRMLSVVGILGVVALLGTILFTDRNGLYCLIAVSGCLSLMFPTIFGLALTGTGSDTKIAGAGLIMAILGGSFFPPIQAAVIESKVTFMGLPSTNVSFIIPLVCLAVVAWYGHRAYVREWL